MMKHLFEFFFLHSRKQQYNLKVTNFVKANEINFNLKLPIVLRRSMKLKMVISVQEKKRTTLKLALPVKRIHTMKVGGKRGFLTIRQ